MKSCMWEFHTLLVGRVFELIYLRCPVAPAFSIRVANETRPLQARPQDAVAHYFGKEFRQLRLVRR